MKQHIQIKSNLNISYCYLSHSKIYNALLSESYLESQNNNSYVIMQMFRGFRYYYKCWCHMSALETGCSWQHNDQSGGERLRCDLRCLFPIVYLYKYVTQWHTMASKASRNRWLGCWLLLWSLDMYGVSLVMMKGFVLCNVLLLYLMYVFYVHCIRLLRESLI